MRRYWKKSGKEKATENANNYLMVREKHERAELFALMGKSITRGNGHKFWPGRKSYTRKAVQHQSKLSSEAMELPPWRFSGLLQTNLQLTCWQ